MVGERRDGGGTWRLRGDALVSLLHDLGNAIRDEPFAQQPDSFARRDARPPTGHARKSARVGDVVLLIAGPPAVPVGARRASVEAADHVQQFAQTDRLRRTAADVERLPGNLIDVARSEEERFDEIVDEEDVAHLLAVAENRD